MAEERKGRPGVQSRKEQKRLSHQAAEKRREVEEKQAAERRSKLEARLKQNIDEALGQSKRVRCNVGGTIFETSTTTLKRYPESLLGRLVEDGHLAKLPVVDGAPLVCWDRSPAAFEIVLDWLRTGYLPLQITIDQRRLVEQEAVFFHLPELSVALGQSATALTAGDVIQLLGARNKGATHQGVPSAGVHGGHPTAGPAALMGPRSMSISRSSPDALPAMGRSPSQRKSMIAMGKSLVGAGSDAVLESAEGLVLRGVNLEGQWLSGLDLAHTDFSDAVLKGANLSHCNLTAVDFSGADLTGANLRECRLNGAVFSGSTLNGCDFSMSDASGAEFRGSDLRGVGMPSKLAKADLSGANLSQAEFAGRDLTQCKLSHAILNQANLRGAVLIRAILDHVDFSAVADMSGANLSHANLTGALLPDVLDGVVLSNATLEGQDLSGVDFSSCKIINTSFKECVLKGAVLPRRLDGCHLGACDLTGRDFGTTSLSRVDFKDANLTGCILPGNLTTTMLKGCCMAECKFRDGKRTAFPADMTSVDLSGAALNGVDFSKCNLGGVKFAGASLRDASLPKTLQAIDFTGVDLTGRDLSGSDLTGSNLAGAVLRGANLSGAVVSGARLPLELMDVDLSEVVLRGRNMRGADLTRAKLRKTDLAGCQLFESKLTGSVMPGVVLSGERVQYTGWDEKQLSTSKQYIGKKSKASRTELPVSFMTEHTGKLLFTGMGSGSWVQFDMMDQAVVFVETRVFKSQVKGDKWRIQCSDDGKEWSTVAETKSLQLGWNAVHWAPAGAHRFWRYYCHSLAKGYCYQGFQWFTPKEFGPPAVGDGKPVGIPVARPAAPAAIVEPPLPKGDDTESDDDAPPLPAAV